MTTKEMVQNLGFGDIEMDSRAVTLIKWNIVIECICTLIFAFTGSTIKIYMVSSVDPIWYQLSQFIEYGLGGLINMGISKKMIIKIRRYFPYFCVADCMLTIVCNIAFAHLPNYRFVSFSLLSVLLTSMIIRIINDLMNNLTSGTDLSILNGKRTGFHQLSAVLGTILILGITFFNVEFTCDQALTIQCIAFVINCLASLIITRRLMKYASYNKKEED